MSIFTPSTPFFPENEGDGHSRGLFSVDDEWHAFVLGFGAGFSAVFPSDELREFVYGSIGAEDKPTSPAMIESKRESWYAVAGVFIGIITAILVITYTAGKALSKVKE